MKRRYRLPLFTLLILAMLLLALHLALPYVVRDYLNDKLAVMGDYRGHIADVDLAWWRGAYRIDGLVIEKADDQVPLPFLEAPGIDLSVSWHALWFDRAIVAQVIFEQPELNFVDADQAERQQAGRGVDWREKLEELLPITLDEVQVIDGRISFHNFESDPEVDIRADSVNASAYDLTNKGDREAHLEGTARLLGEAPLEVRARFDPLSRWQNAELHLRVSDVELQKLNDFSKAYGKFDFAAGSADLVMEVATKDGQLDGYIKPLLYNVEIFDWQQDVEAEDKGFFRGIWEALVGGGENLLKNQSKEQFATRIELSGTLEDKDISPFQAFLAVLRNAFVEAFTPRFERALRENEDA